MSLRDDLAQAPLDILTASVPDTTPVFDGKVPDKTPPPPYIVAYVHTEFPPGADGNSLDGTSAEATTYVYLHCVGATAAAARRVADQAGTALLDVIPTVTGRTCGQLLLDQSQPPTLDETTGKPVMDQVDVYRFVSHPA